MPAVTVTPTSSAPISDERDLMFRARLHRWLPDVLDGLRPLYDDRADALADDLIDLARAAYDARSPSSTPGTSSASYARTGCRTPRCWATRPTPNASLATCEG